MCAPVCGVYFISAADQCQMPLMSHKSSQQCTEPPVPAVPTPVPCGGWGQIGKWNK